MRPKLFFQALLGIVSVGAIIMIVIVYFFGDNQTKVVEKVVEKQVIVYRDAPAAVTPVERETVIQQPAAPAQAPVVESVTPVDISISDTVYTVDDLIAVIDYMLKTGEVGLDYDIGYYDGIVTIKLSDNDNMDLAIDLAAIALNDGNALEACDYMSEGLQTLSAKAREVSIQLGLDDVHVSFMFENPLNLGSFLIITLDDTIMYNFVEDLRDGNT